jgi:hypothetical protein
MLDIKILRKNLSLAKDVTNDVRKQNVLGKNRDDSDIVFLELLLEYLISSKRREKRGDAIEIEHIKKAVDLSIFLKIKYTTLDRILSNLINNSVDSILKSENITNGHIAIETSIKKNFGVITISDNGIGIDQDKILTIFNKGVSFKTNGTGRGLHHAQTELSRIGGSITASSRGTGQGAIFELFIPLEAPPKWSISKIDINTSNKIVVVDDEQYALQLWKSKLEPVQNDILYFSTIESFKEWHSNIKLDNNYIFLVDYEFQNEEKTGADTIIELGIQNSSILATNRADEDNIQKRCLENSISLLHKRHINFLKVNSKIDSPVDKTISPMVYLDDEPVYRKRWEREAAKNNIELQIFSNSTDLLSNLNTMNKNTQFFIDQELGEKKSGSELIYDLQGKGFSNFHIVSLHQKDHFEYNPHIKGYLNKDFPTKTTYYM